MIYDKSCSDSVFHDGVEEGVLLLCMIIVKLIK